MSRDFALNEDLHPNAAVSGAFTVGRCLVEPYV
jgi:hypothetical protein